MADQSRFVSAVHFDRNLYTSSQARERVLNAAIVQADSKCPVTRLIRTFSF
jgi:hypothetical protein